MGRSRFTLRHHLSARRSEEVAERFLTERGLKVKILKSGEKAWKDGSGIVLSPGFLVLFYEDNKTTAFAWIQNGLGLTAKSEVELYGLGMALPKRKMNKLIKDLEIELASVQE